MRFDDIISQIHKNASDRRTERHRAAYKYSPSRRLSRLYGFRADEQGKQIVDKAEAAVVREVIRGFAQGQSAEEIKDRLDRRGMKNRSGKRWDIGALKGLVRPVFAGLVKGPWVGYRVSTVYEPLVSRKEWEKAAKMLKSVTE